MLFYQVKRGAQSGECCQIRPREARWIAKRIAEQQLADARGRLDDVPDVTMLFWRAVTGADFVSVERGPGAAPATGGGQGYFSISFAGLTKEELGRFLAVDPPTMIDTGRPVVALPGVAVLVDPAASAALEFAPRYQLPNADGRYRISRQNRQTQARHPAWSSAYGFPAAPDDITGTGDPRMPDLSHLKIVVARTDDDQYHAGFFNTDGRPPALPQDDRLAPLFEPFQRQRSAGLIEFEAGDLPLEVLRAAAAQGTVPSVYATSPEVQDVLDETRLSAGKRASGQGRRQSASERAAIERRAVDVGTDHLEALGWEVEDVGLFRPYDLHCTRGAESLRVEVKGTTGDGSSVLLTPNEVQHARDEHPHVALIVVSRIRLQVDPGSNEVHATDGDLEMVTPWEFEDGDLRATGYEYRRR